MLRSKDPDAIVFPSGLNWTEYTSPYIKSDTYGVDAMYYSSREGSRTKETSEIKAIHFIVGYHTECPVKSIVGDSNEDVRFTPYNSLLNRNQY